MEKLYNGKIYCIRSYLTDEIYIGSTINMLCKRMAHHRSHYKRYLNGKYHNVTSFEIIKHGDAYIELIIDVENTTKDNLRKIEGSYIREMDCVNRRIEGRTVKEYYNNNKEKINEYKKEYINDNREQIKDYHKEYYNDNKEKINEYMKEYYNENKECKKEYYINNKEKINAKITCECGSKTKRGNMNRHIKTLKHKLFLENNM